MSKLQSAMPKPNISKHLLGHRQDPLRSEKEEETRHDSNGAGTDPKKRCLENPKIWENDC